MVKNSYIILRSFFPPLVLVLFRAHMIFPQSTPGQVTGLPGLLVDTTSLASSAEADLNGTVPATDDNELFQPNKLPNVTCQGFTAFERTLDSAVSPALILNEANRTRSLWPGSMSNDTSIGHAVTQLTFPCNQQCLTADHCVAYITDYNNARCLLLYQRPKTSRAELVPLTGLAYYEKICLKVPVLPCKKEWAFERVVGMELVNNDDLVMHSVPSRIECMQACLQEQSFLCRSAEYHYQTSDCRLSKQNRRTLPNAFRLSEDQVDYLENQCAPEPELCEFRAVEEHMYSVESEVENATNIKDCEVFCRKQDKFNCRAFRFDEETKKCVLSGDDRSSLRNSHVDQQLPEGQAPGQVLFGYMERGECIDIAMSCGPMSMTAILKLNRPFNGRFYPADKPNQCVVVGNNDFQVELAMSLEGDECGSRSLGNGTFVNDVVVQMHPVVLRESDRRVRIACDYPSSKVTLVQDLTVEGIPPRFMDPNQVNLTQTVSGIAALPKVRLQIRNGSGKEVQGAQLGDALILSIDMLEEASAFGIAASDLVAMSGAGDETLQLLDSRGCPVEPSIFPSMSKIKDGRSVTSRFAAFKFASDSIVKFRVTVSFCLDTCPLPDCTGSSLRKRRAAGASVNASSIEDRELTMELAILVDTESNNRVPTMIGKDGVINEAQMIRTRSILCTKGSVIWALGITAAIVQVATISCCLAFIAMYRRLKRQKGDCFEAPTTTTHTMAWNGPPSGAPPKNPDLYRMYQ